MKGLSPLRPLRPLRPVTRLAIAAALTVALAINPAQSFAATAQASFASPEAAMNAFGDAVSGNNEAELRKLFGANFRQLVPPNGAQIRAAFLDQWKVSHAIQPAGENSAHIAVGSDGWTFPVPLVKNAHGWHFDMAAGAEEMRVRRIGRNELAVIQTMLAIYDAQREYASTYHDGSDTYVYARRLASTPGKHDGLYWPTADDEAPSPLGEAFATAGTRMKETSGYYGYHYKLLTSQGPHAPGGAYDYVVRGQLFGGFGVIAWPVKYGDTGIKTFMVSHDGQVYERDLGPNSAAKAEETTSFDPGPGWKKEQDTQADTQSGTSSGAPSGTSSGTSSGTPSGAPSGTNSQ
ncbi:hypothetical protein LMG28688_06822 [Paraburkholderia caffeinitolerans]|uniref:DUF2950 domain-containing protein n=1 Tax=Paraburkholderia caffeinitolerans TaxID=1723730 RepID=A0A6J5GYT8_9BURK|nr:DUF2950 domain-containing protein [Paraburkholderia caffeinitolerans]CAB3808683.1 hypothetical protein LMG28688_06822 [Paraburkholderia caffeinitolerans]